MQLFTNHKIIRKQDSYIVQLYLDELLYEFADELTNINNNQKEKLKNNIRTYIKNNLPKDLKIKAVNIMVGSLLLASIPFSSINAEVTNEYELKSQTETLIYTVKRGDTLYKIAHKYDTSVVELKSINKLTSNIIYVGQQLIIPKKINDIYNYIVNIGDTLFKISTNFRTTIEKIKSYNNLENDTIYVGQQLKIPRQQDVYTVKSGDTLYKIASRYNISISKLKNTNNLTTNTIYIGQTLHIPDVSDVISNPASILVLVNKSHRLSSSYVPENLVIPNVPFPFSEYNPKKQLRQDAALALEEMFKNAKQNNITLYGLSGYRSYARQEAIFTSKAMQRGIEKANQFSAKPGESEHQTGLAMDVTCSSVNYGLTQSFGDTKEGKWVRDNAHKFGFIIRYQRGKEHITKYQYEPWHIRYVGKNAAKYIFDNNITLEEYLGKY